MWGPKKKQKKKWYIFKKITDKPFPVKNLYIDYEQNLAFCHPTILTAPFPYKPFILTFSTASFSTASLFSQQNYSLPQQKALELIHIQENLPFQAYSRTLSLFSLVYSVYLRVMVGFTLNPSRKMTGQIFKCRRESVEDEGLRFGGVKEEDGEIRGEYLKLFPQS